MIIRSEIEEKDLEKIKPIVEGLDMMDKNAGWIWLKEKIEADMKKGLDFLLKDTNIKNDVGFDIERGKIIYAKSIFSEIQRKRNQYRSLMEGKE